MRRRGSTLAVAESCTGGRLAAAFTAGAGASDYFTGGVTAYSNRMKADVLGVDTGVLARHGAVSRQVAEAMAAGVRRIAGADYAISTTGIAGPGGGSPEKPVGTVWIAVADGEAVIARRFLFDGSREEIMRRSVAAAADLLMEFMCGEGNDRCFRV